MNNYIFYECHKRTATKNVQDMDRQDQSLSQVSSFTNMRKIQLKC